MEKTAPKGYVECPTCDGRREAVFSCCTGDLVDDDIAMCPECHEHLGESDCSDCDGTGYVPEDQEEFTDKVEGLQSQSERVMDEQRGH